MKLLRLGLPHFLNLGVLLPLVEIVVLKSLIHINFYIFVEDMALITPAVAALILFVKLNSEEPIELTWNKKLLILHFISLAMFLKFTYWVNGKPLLKYQLSWVFLAGMVFLSAFFSRVKANSFAKRVYTAKPYWFSTIVTASSFSVYQFGKEVWWRQTLAPTARVITYLADLISLPIQKIAIQAYELTLFMPWGSIRVVPGCGGLEGICFFLWLYGIVLLVDGNKFSFQQKVWAGISGMILMWVANVARLALFLKYGAIQFSKVGATETFQREIAIFHSNVGATLYLILLFFFFMVFYGLTTLNTKTT
jgi:exosortase/archaeosortase family protein